MATFGFPFTPYNVNSSANNTFDHYSTKLSSSDYIRKKKAKELYSFNNQLNKAGEKIYPVNKLGEKMIPTGGCLLNSQNNLLLYNEAKRLKNMWLSSTTSTPTTVARTYPEFDESQLYSGNYATENLKDINSFIQLDGADLSCEHQADAFKNGSDSYNTTLYNIIDPCDMLTPNCGNGYLDNRQFEAPKQYSSYSLDDCGCKSFNGCNYPSININNNLPQEPSPPVQVNPPNAYYINTPAQTITSLKQKALQDIQSKMGN